VVKLRRRILSRIENAFKQKTDVFHFAVGFFAGIINLIGLIGFIISIFTTMAFLMYQTGEDEPRIESYINLFEFALGFITSLPFIIIFIILSLMLR